ncbi:MAG: HesA/MoeB/ThiF family protein [Pseudomonadota bacterium]
MAFSDAELERYARHIVLRGLGGPGQARLKAASVLVVGAGGLGAPSLMYLAAAGVGRLTLIDDDIVDLSNLQRQVLFDTASIGMPKAEAALQRLQALNPEIALHAHQVRLDAGNAAELIAGHDLVLDGSDSYATRAVVNAACVAERVPLIAAALGSWEGQISLYAPHLGAPCFACLFPEPPAPGQVPACAEAGVLGALAGIMGSMMAAEAVKFLSGAGTTLAGRLLIYDGLLAETQIFAVERRPDCPICGATAAADPPGQ